jgi:putative redox protein
MKAEVHLLKGLTFVGRADTNHWVAMDGLPEFGGAGAGSQPMELVLIGLAACTGMDVVSILTKKRVALHEFRVAAEAERAENHPKVFTVIKVTYYVRGENVKEKDVAEAIRLSHEKYCSATAMLSQVVEFDYDFEIA